MNKDMHLIFKGFADAHRIEILNILTQCEDCNCNIAQRIDMPLSTLAHHMKVLTNAGLVIPRREGKWTYYSLNKSQFILAKEIIDKFI